MRLFIDLKVARSGGDISTHFLQSGSPLFPRVNVDQRPNTPLGINTKLRMGGGGGGGGVNLGTKKSLL